MDANVPSTPVEQVELETVSTEDIAALDATLREEDWPVIQRMWRAGVTNDSIYRLLRLRVQYGSGTERKYGPHMDGFQPDARANFIRWLVQQGRLNEGL